MRAARRSICRNRLVPPDRSFIVHAKRCLAYHPHDGLYQPKALLSDWERRALLAFRSQIPAGHYVCPQVRLAELVSIVVDPRRFPEALNRVAGKSLDFVVIELATGRPVLAIELDDRSHQQRQRQDRDRFVNDLMEALNIPLQRFTPSMSLDVSGHFVPGPSARQVLARPAR
nr:DUF2726 domain-containing protein [Acetobacter estunensis]